MFKQLIRYCLGAGFMPFRNHFKKDALTVFVYHDITNSPSEFSKMYGLNVPPEVFDYQINFINKYFNVISPDELLAGRIPLNAALITFDDGFKSYFSSAISILEKYNMPSIIFLNMEPIKGAIFWSGLITYLCNKKEDFINHLNASLVESRDKRPLYLYCCRDLVDSYIKNTRITYKEEVYKYVGEFANEKDLMGACEHPLVFYGNHLFNHDVPLLMSDKEFLSSYFENHKALKKYPNYRSLFSFPFGQPDNCFAKRQIELVIKNGAKKVFSSYPVINYDISAPYLHRIPLNSFNNTKARVWFSILRRSFKI